MKEIKPTIQSGKASGSKYSRSAPLRDEPFEDVPEDITFDDIPDSVSSVSNVSNEPKVYQSVSNVANNPRSVSTCIDETRQQKENVSRNKTKNLLSLIGEYIENSGGSFSNAMIDADLCLRSRAERLYRARCLQVYADRKKIKKDKRRRGEWIVIEEDTSFFKVQMALGEPFELNLILSLTGKILIPQKSIIVLAGMSNAGKTLLALRLAINNLCMSFPITYMMSETGAGQYKRRLLKLGVDLAEWDKRVMSAERSSNFGDLIERYNPDGLNIIDFLEEKDGECFMIPSYIRDIYDALNKGVAFVCLQKRKSAEYGKGGEGTREKAALYMRLDQLAVLEDENGTCETIFSAVHLDKVKESLHGGMQGKECHFRIDGGSTMTTVMDWTYSSKVDRLKRSQQYERNMGFPR